MPETRPRRRHLRDAATICPVVSPCPGGDFRCELDAGHDGKHKDGCTHWGTPAADATETHQGFDIAGEPSTHQGPRARCWDPVCERPVRLVEDVIS